MQNYCKSSPTRARATRVGVTTSTTFMALANMRYFTTVRAATPPKSRTQKSPFSAATGAVVAMVAPQNVMLTDCMVPPSAYVDFSRFAKSRTNYA